MATRFLDYSGRVAATDFCRFMTSGAPTALTGGAAWTNAGSSITLQTAGITAMVFDCSAGFTNSANVTGTTSSTRKEGTLASNMIIAGAFTTGLVGYSAFAATDFSAYQQINFWIQTSITVAANTFRVDLCSDAAGATPVNSFTINVALNPSSTWHAIVLDNGSALGNSIQSVALTALLDPGSCTVIIDDIFVSKAPSSADCLTLYSCVRKNAGTNANYGWYTIKSVNGTTVALEKINSSDATQVIAYVGATETVATDVRQCIPLAPVTSANTDIFTIQRFGTSAAMPTYSGGWDTTNMTSQTGETWFIAINGQGNGVRLTNEPGYYNVEKISFVRCNIAWDSDSGDVTKAYFTDCNAISSGGRAWRMFCGECIFTRCTSIISGFAAFDPNSWNSTGSNVYDTCYAYYASGNGWTPQAFDVFKNCQARKCTSYGWRFGYSSDPNSPSLGTRPQFLNCFGSNNTTADVKSDLPHGDVVLINCSMTSTTPYVPNDSTTGSSGKSFGAGFRSHRDGQVTDTHTITLDTALITSELSTRHTASGMAWKIKPSSTDVDVNFTVDFPVRAVKCIANVSKTVKLWFRRGHATHVSASLVCPAYHITGITTDIATAMTAAADTWEQVSITITGHTITDSVMIYARVWLPDATVASTSYVIVDDVNVS